MKLVSHSAQGAGHVEKIPPTQGALVEHGQLAKQDMSGAKHYNLSRNCQVHVSGAGGKVKAGLHTGLTSEALKAYSELIQCGCKELPWKLQVH